MLILLLLRNFSVHATTLNCDYSFERTHNDSLYDCTIRLINDKYERVSQNHTLNKSNEDVESLTIKQITLKSIPLNIGIFFPNLKKLAILSGSITHISKNNLKQFTNIRHIIIEQTNISVLSSGLFEFNENLEEIEFRDNSLDVINVEVFNNLKNLTRVDLTKNICIDESFSKENKSLEDLRRKLAQLCQPENEMFCEHKKGLDGINKCWSRYLDDISKEGVKFSGQYLKDIIDELFITQGIFRSFPKYLFEEFPNLETLEIKKCLTTSIIGNDFMKASKLKKLVLLDINVDKLTSNTFKFLLHLETLFLSSTTLKSIGIAVFNDLENLKTIHLDLQQCTNKLKSFSQKELVDLNSSEIKQNCKTDDVFRCIHDIETFSYVSDSNVKTCYARSVNLTTDVTDSSAHNTIEIYKLVEFITSHGADSNVRALVVENQILNSFPKLLFVQAQKLLVLSIRNSHLKVIKKQNYFLLFKLQHLDASDNEIEFINFQNFEPLKDIRFINLSNNKLSASVFYDSKPHKYLKCVNMQNNIFDMDTYYFPEDKETFKKELMACSSFDIANKSNNNNITCDHISPETCSVLTTFDINQTFVLGNVYVLANEPPLDGFQTIEIVNRTFRRLPDNLSDFFLNITNITIIRTRLEILSLSTFRRLQRLKHVVIIHNELKTISTVLFFDNIHLKYLDFSYNKIVSVTLFPPLRKLVHFHLREAGCVDVTTDNMTLNKVYEAITKNCTTSSVFSASVPYRKYVSQDDMFVNSKWL